MIFTNVLIFYLIYKNKNKIMKKLFETFLKNKWHLHSLTLPACILWVWLMVTYDFLDLRDTGKFFHVFICTFSSLAVAFVVEWLQGKFFGANRTAEQVKASNLDMLASTVAGFVGGLSAVIFPPASTLAWLSLVIITILELYRRKYILNKKDFLIKDIKF
jgi:hypothetical protein